MFGGSFGSTLTFAVSARMEGACMERYREVRSFGKLIGRKLGPNRAVIEMAKAKAKAKAEAGTDADMDTDEDIDMEENTKATNRKDCPRRAVSSFHGCQQETYAYV